MANGPIWPAPSTKTRRGFQNLKPLPRHSKACSVALAQTLAGCGGTLRCLRFCVTFDDVLRVANEHLGQITVTKIDAALVLDLFAGDVFATDGVEERPARPANREAT